MRRLLRKVLALTLMITVVCGLSGCCITHNYAPATCTTAATCTKCGKTEGEALGHSWSEATCTKAKTCTVCGETTGNPLVHKADEVTCTEASVCNVCGEVVEKAKGHDWQPATREAPKTCSVCGTTEGDPLPVAYFNMTFTEFKNAFNNLKPGQMLIVPVEGSGFYLTMGNSLNTSGTQNVVLVLHDDEFNDTPYENSTEELEQFNELSFMYATNYGDDYTVDGTTVMWALEAQVGAILDSDFDQDTFIHTSDINKGNDSAEITNSMNGFDYTLMAHSYSPNGTDTQYLYIFKITLTGNN